MPKLSDFGDLQVAYPDLDDLPADAEFIISAGGKEYNLTPDQLRTIIGAAAEETGAEIGAKLDAEYGTDWRATPTEGAPLLDEDDFASNSATAAPSQQSTEARITSKIATATAPIIADVALKAVSTDLAAVGGGALIGCNTPEGYTATNVQALLDEFAAAIDLRALSTDALDVSDATPVVEGAIGDTDYVLFELADGTGFGKAQKNTLGLGGAVPNIQTGTSYTITADDAGRLIIMDSSSANTVTFPANATTELPVGFTCSVSQGGAGTTTIEAESVSVVLGGAAGGAFEVDARFGIVVLVKTATNEVYATGDRGAIVDSTAPTIQTLSPADGATGVSINGSFVATFSEPIAVGTGDVVLRSAGSAVETFNIATGAGDNGGTVAVSGNQLTITPGDPLTNSAAYAVQIAGTCIDDLAGNSFAGIGDDTTWNVTTVASSTGATIVASAFHEILASTGANYLNLPAVAQEGDRVVVFEVCDAILAANIPNAAGGATGGYSEIYSFSTNAAPAFRVHTKVMGAVPDTQVSVNSPAAARPVAVGIVLIRSGHADLDGIPATVGGNADQGPLVVPAYAQTSANVLRLYGLGLDDVGVTLTGVGGSWQTLLTGFTTATSGNNASLIVEYLAAGGSALDEVAPGTVTGGADQWSSVHFGVKPA